MQTITSGERARLAGHANYYLRVEVRDGANAWRDVSVYVQSVSFGETIDAPVASGSVTLKRESGGVSLSTLMTSSSLNMIGGVYAPLLDLARGVRISTAVTAHGVAPITADWKEVFIGQITDIDFGADPISMTIADLGSYLTDVQIESERDYGDAAGAPIEGELQKILDDNLGAGVVTLVTPVSPTWNITPFTLARGSLMEGIRTLALQIGWDVRYRYDSSNVSQLTFFSVDRAKTTPDATIGPAEYLNVQRLAISNADIRNVVKVNYQDSVTGLVSSQTASDAGSIAEFGRRYMEIGEGSSSNIDTSAEALAMAVASVNDLSEPLADQAIEQFYFWAVQLGDLLLYLANGVHYDTDQSFGVVGVQHTLAINTHRTVISVRGNIAGAYRAWLTTRAGQFDGQVSTGPSPEIFPLLGELQAFQDSTRDGMAWVQVKFEPSTVSIPIYAIEGVASPVPIASVSSMDLAYELIRQEGDRWNAPDASYIVPIATRPNYYRKIVAYGLGPATTGNAVDPSSSARGPTIVREVQAVDVGTGPSGPPTSLIITTADTTNRVVWTNGDATAFTIIMRNGIGQVLQPGVTAFLDTNINPDISYTYKVFHWKNGQTSAQLPTTGGGTTLPPPSSGASAPVWQTGFPVSVGINGVDYRWTAPSGTTEVTIQINKFLILSIFSDLQVFTDAGHIPSGVFTDTSQPAGTVLQARIRALVAGDYYYSPAVSVTYGLPPLGVKPKFVAGTPYFDGSSTDYAWSLASTAATSLDILKGSTVIFHTTVSATIQNGSTNIVDSTIGGRDVRVRANYPGGITATSDPVTVNTHTGGL